MPKYKYPLANGKHLVIEGDDEPDDDYIESEAKRQGVKLKLADEFKQEAPVDTSIPAHLKVPQKQSEWTPPVAPSKTGISRAWEIANKPLTDYLPEEYQPGNVGRKISDWITTPDKDSTGSFWDRTKAQARGFYGGTWEGGGDVLAGLSSPLNIATALLSGGTSVATKAGLPSIARSLNMGEKAAGALMVGHGGSEIIRPDATPFERAMGAFEVAGGGAAALHTPSFNKPKVKAEPIPHDLTNEVGNDAQSLANVEKWQLEKDAREDLAFSRKPRSSEIPTTMPPPVGPMHENSPQALSDIAARSRGNRISASLPEEQPFGAEGDIFTPPIKPRINAQQAAQNLRSGGSLTSEYAPVEQTPLNWKTDPLKNRKLRQEYQNHVAESKQAGRDPVSIQDFLEHRPSEANDLMDDFFKSERKGPVPAGEPYYGENGEIIGYTTDNEGSTGFEPIKHDILVPEETNTANDFGRQVTNSFDTQISQENNRLGRNFQDFRSYPADATTGATLNHPGINPSMSMKGRFADTTNPDIRVDILRGLEPENGSVYDRMVPTNTSEFGSTYGIKGLEDSKVLQRGLEARLESLPADSPEAAILVKQINELPHNNQVRESTIQENPFAHDTGDEIPEFATKPRINAIPEKTPTNTFESIRGNEPVYHGTQNVFESFGSEQNKPQGLFRGMTRFTENPEYSSLYSLNETPGGMKREPQGQSTQNRPNTIAAQLEANNVLDLTKPIEPTQFAELQKQFPELQENSSNQFVQDVLSRSDKPTSFDAIRFSEHGENNWAVPEGTGIKTPSGVRLQETWQSDPMRRRNLGERLGKTEGEKITTGESQLADERARMDKWVGIKKSLRDNPVAMEQLKKFEEQTIPNENIFDDAALEAAMKKAQETGQIRSAGSPEFTPDPESLGARWNDSVTTLDKAGAPDTAYRDIMSSGSRTPLKSGETWRSRVMRIAERDRIKQLNKSNEGPVESSVRGSIDEANDSSIANDTSAPAKADKDSITLPSGSQTTEVVNELRAKGYRYAGQDAKGDAVFKKSEEPIPVSTNAVPIVRRIKDIEPDKAGIIRELWNAPRGMMSVDLPFITSAALRQALPLIGTKAWFKAWIPSIKSYGSKAFYDAHSALLQADPLMQRSTRPVMTSAGTPLMKQGRPVLKEMPSILEKAGVQLNDLKTFTGREEAIRSTLPEKIPGYGKIISANNRAYSAYINDIRVNTFRNLYDAMPNKNDMVALKQIGDAVGTFTGRGRLETMIPFTTDPKTGGRRVASMERHAEALAEVLFAPKLVASRLQMLNPVNYTMMQPQVRLEYVKAFARTAGAWGTFASAAKMAGADVTLDPFSADFGKIKLGNLRLDPAGGIQQFLVLGARMASNKFTSSTSGRTFELGKGFGAQTKGDVLQNFISNKFQPYVKFFYDAAFASERRPFNVFDRAAQLAVPMMIGDMIDVAKKEPELLPWLAPLVSAGVGSQYYSKNEPYGKSKIVSPMLGMMGVDKPEQYDITLGK